MLDRNVLDAYGLATLSVFIQVMLVGWFVQLTLLTGAFDHERLVTVLLHDTLSVDSAIFS